MKGQKQLFSKGKDNWQTPKKLFDELNAIHHFTVDGAADSTNHLCERWYGPGSPIIENALNWLWEDEIVWLNPPYSMVKEFVAKAFHETYIGGCKKVVLLVPARTDTKWWHEYVWDVKNGKPYANVEINFLKGRVKFVDPDNPENTNSAPFPSVIIVME